MAHQLIRILALALPLFLATASPLLADSIVLEGGKLIFGTYTGGGPDEFRMGSGEKSLVYARKTVVAVAFGTGRLKTRLEPMISETDRLELEDGTVIEGRYAGGDESALRFEVDGETQTLPLKTLARLTLGHTDPAASKQREDQP